MKYNRLPRFFTDESEDSQITRKLLKKYGVEVVERVNGVDDILEKDWPLPSIMSGDGWFCNLGGIKSYIELVADISPLKSLD